MVATHSQCPALPSFWIVFFLFFIRRNPSQPQRYATQPHLYHFFPIIFFFSSSILCLGWNGMDVLTIGIERNEQGRWISSKRSSDVALIHPTNLSALFLFFSFFAVVLFSILPMFYYLNGEMGGLLLSWFRIFDGRLNGWSPYLYFNCSWWVSRFKAKDPQFSNKRETDGNFHFLAPVEGQFSFLLRVLVERKERESINI